MERVKHDLCKEFKTGTKGAHQYSWEAQSLQVEDGCYIGPCNEESGKKLAQHTKEIHTQTYTINVYCSTKSGNT